MRMITISWIFFTQMIAGGVLFSQPLLTLEEAVEIGLENNLGIRIAQNEEAMAANRATKGAAGLLPTAGLNGSLGYRNQNTEIEFASPGIEPVDVRGAGTTVYAASVDVNYVLFEGFARKNRYKRLLLDVELAGSRIGIQAESIVYRIMQNYAVIQSAVAAEATAEKSLEISAQRLERSREALRYGTGSGLTVMEAEVALQQDSLRWLTASQQLRLQKRSLNRFLQRDQDADFSVEGEITLDNGLAVEAILDEALGKNRQLLLLRRQQDAAKLDEEVTEGSFWPRVGLNASYAYNRQENEAGFILNQTTLGPVTGISLQFPLYDGGLRKKQLANARIAGENALLQAQDFERDLELDIRNAYDRYTLALDQLEREQRTVALAEQVMQRTREMVELGQLSQLDFRQAQLNWQRATDMLVTLRLEARRAELDLLRLAGQL
jgi:outer membrane protein